MILVFYFMMTTCSSIGKNTTTLISNNNIDSAVLLECLFYDVNLDLEQGGIHTKFISKIPICFCIRKLGMHDIAMLDRLLCYKYFQI